jgi:hypothetical protein
MISLALGTKALADSMTLVAGIRECHAPGRRDVEACVHT